MRRAGSLVLGIVLSSSPLLAAVAEIPPKYLEEEKRIRAAMSQHVRHRSFFLVDRTRATMSVADVRALTKGESADTIFLVMLEYLKMLQKEAREDRKRATASTDAALAAKEAKIQLDSSKIADQKREAEKRFDAAMQAANLELLLGAVNSAAAVAAAIPTKTPTPASRPLDVKVR